MDRTTAPDLCSETHVESTRQAPKSTHKGEERQKAGGHEDPMVHRVYQRSKSQETSTQMRDNTQEKLPKESPQGEGAPEGEEVEMTSICTCMPWKRGKQTGPQHTPATPEKHALQGKASRGLERAPWSQKRKSARSALPNLVRKQRHENNSSRNC